MRAYVSGQGNPILLGDWRLIKGYYWDPLSLKENEWGLYYFFVFLWSPKEDVTLVNSRVLDVLRHVEEGPFDNEGFRRPKSLKGGRRDV